MKTLKQKLLARNPYFEVDEFIKIVKEWLQEHINLIESKNSFIYTTEPHAVKNYLNKLVEEEIEWYWENENAIFVGKRFININLIVS